MIAGLCESLNAIVETGATVRLIRVRIGGQLGRERTRWTKPAAIAISKENYFEMERGGYDPVYPRTPACPCRCSARPASRPCSPNLDGFPEDWKENPKACVKFVQEYQCPSFLEYAEYPYVTADETRRRCGARRLLGHARPDVLDRVQSAADVQATMDHHWITLAFTWNGLRTLGVPGGFADDFPDTSSARAWRCGRAC